MTPNMKAVIAIELCGAWSSGIYQTTGKKRMKHLSDKFFKLADTLKERLTDKQINAISKLYLSDLEKLPKPNISDCSVLIACFAGTAIKHLKNSPRSSDHKIAKRLEELSLSKTVQNHMTTSVTESSIFSLSYEWHKALKLY